MARVRVKVRRGVDISSPVYSRGELAETLKAVKKRYGETTVRIANGIYQPDRISTGSFLLDFCLLGGFPVSRASMVVGERHAGKSMLGSKLIASAQKQFPDQTPVILDIEGTFESVWAKQLGVDTSSLPVVPCETGEMAVDIGEALIQSSETSLLVVDSIAAIMPMAERDSSAEDVFVGLQARLIGRFIRKTVSALISERKRGHAVSILFLNQFRSRIGGPPRGDPRTIPGGKALEFATTVQMILKNKENKGKDETTGIESMSNNEHPFTITKNKLNGGPRTGEFVLVRQPTDVLQAGYIDDALTMVGFAKKFGIYTGAGRGQHLEFGDWDLTFGKVDEAVEALREDPGFYWDLRNYLIQLQAAKLGMPEEFIERIGNMVNIHE